MSSTTRLSNGGCGASVLAGPINEHLGNGTSNVDEAEESFQATVEKLRWEDEGGNLGPEFWKVRQNSELYSWEHLQAYGSASLELK